MPTTAAAPLGRDEIVDLITVAASTFRHTGHPADERWNASIREVLDAWKRDEVCDRLALRTIVDAAAPHIRAAELRDLAADIQRRIDRMPDEQPVPDGLIWLVARIHQRADQHDGGAK